MVYLRDPKHAVLEADRRHRAPGTSLANWRLPPYNKWAFTHARELIPSAKIAVDPEGGINLPFRIDDLASLVIRDGEQNYSLKAFLEKTDTDALIVVRRGTVVHRYFADEELSASPHILMSVSKSVLGVLIGILQGQGILDVDATIETYVPEIASTAYGGATIRNLLDMRAGVWFDENYGAVDGLIVEYRKAQGWNPYEPGEITSDLHSFYRSMTRTDSTHDGRFQYASPNSDLLGWVIERAASEPYADQLGRLLWARMGASGEAYITVDRLGSPRCAGGVCVTAMDLALLGQLILDGGRRAAHQIIPESWIEDTVSGGSISAWESGNFADYFPQKRMSYRNNWYYSGGKESLLFGLGIHGQNLFVDLENQIVIVKQSSQAMAMDMDLIRLTMLAIDSLRETLR